MMIHATIVVSVFFFLGALGMAAIDNPLVELSTRDELVRLAGYGEEKLSTVVVGGTVLCLDRKSSPVPIPGALVAVPCRKTSKSNWARGRTDRYGDFLVDLPSHLHAIPDLEKRCLVRIVGVPRTSPCHRAFTGKHKGMKLSSSENGVRTYTTHEIHLKQGRASA